MNEGQPIQPIEDELEIKRQAFIQERQREALEKQPQMAEFLRFKMPEVYGNIEEKPDRYATLYDGSGLLRHLREQRKGNGLSSLLDSMRAVGLTRGRFVENNYKTDQEKAVVREVCVDYTETDDNVGMFVYTKNHNALAENLADYFDNRIVALYNDNFFRNRVANMSPSLKAQIFSNLNTIYNYESDPTPADLRAKANTVDIGFEVYPGITSQIRFTNTFDLATNPQKRYPFMSDSDYSHAKLLWFNNPIAVKGTVEAAPDVGMQLELLDFLKNAGHQPVLQIRQNAGYYLDYPEKEHRVLIV